ncbi:MAG: MotA/TolQ/ExbB proton channel family protein [Scytonema sp. PMC 1069.18]|nr:MotA/TolQ/ExbB proton channel family protein [Scytonema sp. PMC 1069.18]MEC4885466.1 MotA/TolQ/ExbB proton channel family protein [Scytonema sp. PMC 1070.18]
MTRIYDTFLAGGLVMWPLLGLSIVTVACIMERSWFWCRLVLKEKQVVREVLTAAKVDLQKAEIIAERAGDIAIGRFLIEPLRLIRFRNLSPENIHLAIKAAWDKELMEMRKGDVLLESIIAIAPLLGILGTASGLITAFTQLKTGNENFSAFYTGVAQALITSTTGIAIAIFAFVFLRIFWILRSQQMDFFSQVGNDLELIYLQLWYKPSTPKFITEKKQTPPDSTFS